ncbi:MAG: O-antigen ligase family protein [Deltaproteobacteria bacterium]|nr:O-antigen ligase family protein [Deltaproteobacteria bacterium]
MTTPARNALVRVSPKRPGRNSAASAQAPPREDPLLTFKVLAFLAAHIPLAVAIRASSLISTGHALATFGLGLFFAMKDRNPNRVIPVMGYIVGAEILWRGTGAKILWESGKYSICLMAMILIFRFSLHKRIPRTPVIYFALLLPSIAVMPGIDRQLIAKNLSGPFALAVCVALFSCLRLSQSVFRNLCFALVAPILGLAAISTFSTFSAADLHFTGSTKITSAGIGPNQVSAALGLGAVFALFYAFIERQRKLLYWSLLIVALWLLGQSVLTFSRGGLANCLGALAVGGFFLLGDRRSRGGAVIRGALAGAVGLYLLFPALDAMTGGNLGKRFSDPSLTGRDRIIQGDLLAFRENPILGVGPGYAAEYHEIFFRLSSAHTEYTRMLAEHGSLGLLSLLLLLGMSVKFLAKKAPPLTRAFRATMIAWALLYLFHSATRLAAPSFTFGLATALMLAEVSPIRRPSTRPSPPRALGKHPSPSGGAPPPQWPAAVPSPLREARRL